MFQLHGLEIVNQEAYRHSVLSALGVLGGFAGMLGKILEFVNRRIQKSELGECECPNGT